MIRKQDYLKLGTFVIIGTLLLVFMVVVLGAGQYFKTTLTVETYIQESVNGLDIGSPVKLKGVKVGSVSDIGFVHNRYSEDYRYVLVECQLDLDRLGSESVQQFMDKARRDVQRGLRMKPSTIGLTGQLYLNIDYVDPKANPPLRIDWQPENLYIPSVPSTLNKLEAAVTNISNFVKGLSKEDIEAIITQVRKIVEGVGKFMKTAEGKNIGKLIQANLTETEKTLRRVNQILSDPAAEQIIPDAAGAMAGVRDIVERSGDDVVAAVSDARSAMKSFKSASAALEGFLNDPKLAENMDGLGETLKNVNDASVEVKASVLKLHAVLNRLNMIAAGQQGTIRAILEDARTLMENLKELSGDAKRYPSGVIFGAPPAKTSPGDER
ncbi:MlaD family protein [Salidesulfovibrio brasiliensis]|uniref:MlaD family protein n=1 Tax=Salidesulfovibrio brasiliensis TaxID=221711 RepID=UPI0006D24C38|nr:MlaD family protein [Salidesulfovibrio brasiliensis]